jgi:hypothetical protein
MNVRGYSYCRGRERRRVNLMKKKGKIIDFMRSKRKISSLMLVMFFLIIVSPASADLGAPVYSSWTTNPPTIDGAISGGEWTDAAVRDFTFDMRLRGLDVSIENLSARFYVKNDANNIYAAVQIFDEDYDAANLGNHYDAFALLFEDNHDHVLVFGDNGVGIHMWPGSSFHTNNDAYYNSSSTQWLPDAGSPPSGAGKTNDGAFSWSHTNPVEEGTGTYTFEMTIPLVGSDGDAYDLAITSCATTLGFKIWFHEKDEGMDGVYPDDTATWPNDLEIIDGTKFGNLVLACPPPAVGGLAAPIVIPPNGANLLTPLIWLASVIMVPIALTVIIIKLKKKTL